MKSPHMFWDTSPTCQWPLVCSVKSFHTTRSPRDRSLASGCRSGWIKTCSPSNLRGYHDEQVLIKGERNAGEQLNFSASYNRKEIMLRVAQIILQHSKYTPAGLARGRHRHRINTGALDQKKPNHQRTRNLPNTKDTGWYRLRTCVFEEPRITALIELLGRAIDTYLALVIG